MLAGSSPPRATDRPGRRYGIAAAATGYAVLGSILCVTRFAGLDRGYASDELMTVREYLREGPREILFGTYIPNNHELFSLLGWATTSIIGESAVALRLWSAVPFVLGVILVTAWLHVRVGTLSGLLFLFFATASPLLLDITRQARGYGLAFLAMSVLVVAALEAYRHGSTRAIVAFCAGGLMGTLTLPHFAIAFAATGAGLLAKRELRRPVVAGLVVSFGVVAVAYAPHVDDLFESSRQDYGAPIEGGWILTAPIDQILIPALRWIDETLMDPGIASLVVVVALALVLASSPLLRRHDQAWIVSAGIIATIVVFWLTRTNVAPRFFSFLLVPLLMLLSSGAATIVGRFGSGRPPIARAVIVFVLLGSVLLIGAPQTVEIVRLPREAVRDVANTVRTNAPRSTPVVAYVPYPRDLEYFLGRTVTWPTSPTAARSVCKVRSQAVFVSQPWILESATIPCTRREGVRHVRFEQYARGGQIDVWFIPAS